VRAFAHLSPLLRKIMGPGSLREQPLELTEGFMAWWNAITRGSLIL